MTAGLLCVIVFARCREKPALMRDALWILLPLLVTCMLWGFFDELRDYYEGFPILVMLAAPTVAGLMGVPIAVRLRAPERVPLRDWIAGASTEP
jgi:hypothetical protein